MFNEKTIIKVLPCIYVTVTRGGVAGAGNPEILWMSFKYRPLVHGLDELGGRTGN